MFKIFKQQLYHLRKNSSRVYLYEFVRMAAQSVDPGSLVLDAGAGECLYRPLFQHLRYESADFCQVEGKNYGEITYRCDLSQIPVEDEHYDLILCTQTLEHVPEPKAVLLEFNRILKPGKKLWLSVPLFFAEHEAPYDYYRYTQYGLCYLLDVSGFEVSRIEALEGYYGALSYQCEMAAVDLSLNCEDYGGGVVGFITVLPMIFFKPFLFLLSLLFARLDLRYKYIKNGMSKNYSVIAVKRY